MTAPNTPQTDPLEEKSIILSSRNPAAENLNHPAIDETSFGAHPNQNNLQQTPQFYAAYPQQSQASYPPQNYPLESMPSQQPPYGIQPQPHNQPMYYPPAYQQPSAAPQGLPQIVIQNTSTSHAGAHAKAMSGGFGWRKRQSFWVHVILFLFTAGLGNVLYAWYVISWNRRHGF